MRVEFNAWEYWPDARLRPADYTFDGTTDGGWQVAREGKPHLALGAGYRPLTAIHCGVCSTDLDRHHLPFPLPQITGHEVIARDEAGARYAVEINASHRARGVAADGCPFCRIGLDTHCPERLVLGIHDLPGGFGAHLLAPVRAALRLPDGLAAEDAVIVEPFAAALHAVTSLARRPGDRIAVLGPRKLGALVVAALAATRRQTGEDLSILALSRRPALRDLARQCGADDTPAFDDDGPVGLADIVVDTTGSPEGLVTAVRLARREVHLKSTHGRPSAGLAKLTAFVVDELGLARLPSGAAGWAALAAPLAALRTPPVVAWTAAAAPPAWLESAARVARGADAAALLARLEAAAGPGEMAQADAAVVDGAAGVDAAIRPSPAREVGLVRPRGLILVDPRGGTSGSPLLEAVAACDLRLTSTRCGRFEPAIERLAADAALRANAARLVTHEFPAARLPEAFAAARSGDCIKAVVHHAA